MYDIQDSDCNMPILKDFQGHTVARKENLKIAFNQAKLKGLTTV